MSNILISRAGIADLELLRKIGMSTFVETFGPVNTPENMEKYLAENFTDKKLSAEIISPDSAFFLAWYDEELIGYLKLNFGDAQTEIKDNHALEIERIYIIQKFHGLKAGHLLLQKALEIAAERNASYLWLGVWEENKRAIAFYLKNGFRQFDAHNFILGNDVQTDILMKLELNQ